MQSVDQVFMSVVQGAVELQDPQSQKHCFIILKKLTETWGQCYVVTIYSVMSVQSLCLLFLM